MLRASPRPRHLYGTASWAALALLASLALNLGTGRYVGSGDTAPAELFPVALLEHGTWTFEAFVEPGEPLPYWLRERDGRILSNYPILPGLMNVPVFAAARTAGVPIEERRFALSRITAALLASFSVLFLFLALCQVCRSEGEAFAFAMLYAVGTLVWSVAGRGLHQHGPSLFFLTFALWMLLRDRPVPTALSGLALGLAVIARPANVLIALPLAFFALRRRRRGFPGFAALAAVPALLHAAYAAVFWGSPFSLAQTLLPAHPFSGNAADGLAGLLLSPSRGLFVFSPVLLFAIPAGVAAFRRSGDLLDRCLVVAALLLLAVTAHWRIWWGGHSFGYRLLIELLPLLLLPIARFWPEIAGSRLATASFVGLAAASVLVQWLGVSGYPSGFDTNIDREPERLWQIRDGEIARLSRVVLGGAARAGAPSEAVASRPVLAAPAPRWWSASLDDERIPAVLDAPAGDDAIRGDLHVFGWAASAKGPVEAQLLLSPGDRAVPMTRGPRPDVCAAMPGLGDCSRAGFHAVLPAPSRPEEHVLTVEVREQGGRVRRLGPIRVFWRAP